MHGLQDLIARNLKAITQARRNVVAVLRSWLLGYASLPIMVRKAIDRYTSGETETADDLLAQVRRHVARELALNLMHEGYIAAGHYDEVFAACVRGLTNLYDTGYGSRSKDPK